MSTDYTTAQERFLISMADDVRMHSNSDTLVKAARAVLEEGRANEEETQAILADQRTMDALRKAKQQRDAGELLEDSAVRPCQTELTELKRRVEVVLEWGAYYDRTFKTEENWSQEEGDMLRAYRALLAERGKDA